MDERANGDEGEPWLRLLPSASEKNVDRRPDPQTAYVDMIGYLPPRVASRFAFTGKVDPDALAIQEQLRSHAFSSGVFDDKTVQLIVFAMMVVELSDAATMHAHAARRAGATWEELQAIVTLGSVFRGVPAANRGADILAKVAKQEWAEQQG